MQKLLHFFFEGFPWSACKDESYITFLNKSKLGLGYQSLDPQKLVNMDTFIGNVLLAKFENALTMFAFFLQNIQGSGKAKPLVLI